MRHIIAYLGVTILSRTIERMTSLFLFLRGRDLCSSQGSSRRFLSPKSQIVNDNVHLWHTICRKRTFPWQDYANQSCQILCSYQKNSTAEQLVLCFSQQLTIGHSDERMYDRSIKPSIDQKISVKQLTSFVGDTKESHRPKDTKMMRRESIFLSETAPAKWLHFQLCQNSCY